jgi:hypothetical protein
MLRISITIEGPALEMAARLRAVAAALEDEPRIRNHITDDSPAPTINRNIVTDNGPSMPEGLNRNHIADDHPAQVEPSPAPPRQNGPTAAQRAALEAYRASLPKKTPPAPPAPRPAVELQVPAPAKVTTAALNEKPRRKPTPPVVAQVATPEPLHEAIPAPRERSGSELWAEVKDAGPKLDWFVALGKARGWPALIKNWSPLQVREARAAWDRKPAPAPC